VIVLLAGCLTAVPEASRKAAVCEPDFIDTAFVPHDQCDPHVWSREDHWQWALARHQEDQRLEAEGLERHRIGDVVLSADDVVFYHYAWIWVLRVDRPDVVVGARRRCGSDPSANLYADGPLATGTCDPDCRWDPYEVSWLDLDAGGVRSGL
jgi:hypothetical protein